MFSIQIAVGYVACNECNAGNCCRDSKGDNENANE